MTKTGLFSTFVLAAASQASATCINYAEQGLTEMPVLRICYDDKCDVARQEFVCARSAGFDIGWWVGDDGTGETVITWQGRRIDPSNYNRITCFEIEGMENGGCAWFLPG